MSLRDWTKQSGAFRIGELSADDSVLKHLTIGTKYLECTSTGTIAIPSKQAYGTWEFDFNKSAGTTYLMFISDRQNGTYNDMVGYTFAIIITGVPNLIKSSVGSYLNLNYTAAGYVNNYNWYRYKLTRTINGSFTVYIKGGSFGNNWTLVSTTGGSGTNPVTDNTYNASNYFTLKLNSGDKIANIKIYDGVRQ